jgi:hypothetical protein
MIGILSYSQISPGDLSQAHAKLEGMSNCTQCHELGDKVTDSKCLECHKEIQSLINKKRGFHADPVVKKQNCIECHSEHHGRKFDMVRFDEKTFNHDKTGYVLEGKHEEIDCKKCHMPDNIKNTNLKKRAKTFMGLDRACLTCHDDYHQKTLDTDCKKCHDFKVFKPASKFNHDTADFKLTGKHIDVKCVECHDNTTKNGKDFQEFKGIAFANCTSCHDDPHNNQLLGDCKSCHTDSGFEIFNGQKTFNHNDTNFTLKGKHADVDCFKCHKQSTDSKLVFQDNLTLNETNCVQCHKDVHESKFGSNCAKCHNEKSFLTLNNMDFFDHSVTDYPLKGKHVEVDCKKCHKGSYVKPVDFSECNKCHKDYHEGEFKEKNAISPDCVQCHSLEEGFEYSLYTLEQHQKTKFRLEGAHIATPCFACHVGEKEKRWTFRNLGTDCNNCHKDIHDGFISKKYYPENDCKSCHINESWSKINSFDHNKTKFKLDGKHTEIGCSACHFSEGTKNKSVAKQKFINLDAQCASCHENKHDELFAINGVTDCVRCHITSSWMPSKFNHSTTRFPLEGKHLKVACNECHTSSTINGKAEVLYKLNKLQCIDCHQ